jgi:enhancing lycopene biosynthesis protein 2
MKKIGVILSGCGVYDGAEIHESVLTLLEIQKAGAKAVCMAPNTPQMHVINHLTGKEMDESRNVLVESARIARGDIQDIAGIWASDLDALILPGGFGAAKNLCDFAVKGHQASVHPEVARLVREMSDARKPVGLICIAPAVGALVLGDKGVHLTIGNDADTAANINKLGALHVDCAVGDVVEDPNLKIISTPAYMLGQNIAEVAEGIGKLVRTLISWA